MGKRKKSEAESLPPLKMVIGLSPEHKKARDKKSQDKQKYAVLDKSDNPDKMRSKRKASNIDPKKWKDQSDEEDDDDIEVLEVYKAPKVHRKNPRVPAGATLIMDCVDEELSKAQTTALKRINGLRDDVSRRVSAIKKQYGERCIKVEHSEEYLGPESVKVITRPAPQNAGTASPDVIMMDEQPKQAQAAGSNAPTPVQPPAPVPGLTPGGLNFLSPGLNTQLRPGMPALPVGAGVKAQIQGNNIVLLGPNDQPLQVIPPQVLAQGNQSFVVRTGTPGQVQMVNPGPPRPQAMFGNMVPPVPTTLSASGFSHRGRPPGPSPRPVPVSGTGGLGIKRSAPVPIETAQVPQLKKPRGRQRKQMLPLIAPEEEDDKVNWVPLDEYYYSKKEGDPAYREQKGEYRFKCWYCCKMLYNNLRIMMHIQGHIDSEKQQNLDLSDLTQCKHCYKQFDTPFEMQCHVEKVHQNQSNVLVCRICEKDHLSQGDLKMHMRVHNTCEMPYICQLCNFRSSVYNDVVDHFKKRHDSSAYMLCFYCLKTFETKFAKNAGWGMTQVYYQHLIKHQTKGNNKKCSRCKLAFTNKAELVLHKNKDHLPNYRGILGGTSGSTLNANSEQVMIRVPDSHGQTQSKGKLKSLNAPVNKLAVLANIHYYGLERQHRCVECKKRMNSIDHYKKYTECSMCRYATACNEAYSNHMSGFHSRGGMKTHCAREKPLPKKMFCLCGFSCMYGSKIANHLIFCSKRTCYAEKPEVRFFEYDDEQEEYNPFEPYSEEPDTSMVQEGTPEKDIPSLFGALGLVKKPPSRLHSRPCSKESSPFREPSPTRVVQQVLDDILDNMFPAEAAAEQFVQTLVKNVFDEIDDKRGKKFRSEAQIALQRSNSETGSQLSCSTEGSASRQSIMEEVAAPELNEHCTDQHDSTTKVSIFVGSGSTSDLGSLSSEKEASADIATSGQDVIEESSPGLDDQQNFNVDAPMSEDVTSEEAGAEITTSRQVQQSVIRESNLGLDGHQNSDVGLVNEIDSSDGVTLAEEERQVVTEDAKSEVTQIQDIEPVQRDENVCVDEGSNSLSEAPKPGFLEQDSEMTPDEGHSLSSPPKAEEAEQSEMSPEAVEADTKPTDAQASGSKDGPVGGTSPEGNVEDKASTKETETPVNSADDTKLEEYLESTTTENEQGDLQEDTTTEEQKETESVGNMQIEEKSAEDVCEFESAEASHSELQPNKEQSEMEESQLEGTETSMGESQQGCGIEESINPPSAENDTQYSVTETSRPVASAAAEEHRVSPLVNLPAAQSSTFQKGNDRSRDADHHKHTSWHNESRSHDRSSGIDRHGNHHGSDKSRDYDRNRERNRDYDRNRDYHHDNSHYRSKDHGWHNDRDRYGGHSQHRQDGRHGNHQRGHPYQGHHRGGYQNDRHGNRGGYRGGRGNYYGNQGYY